MSSQYDAANEVFSRPYTPNVAKMAIANNPKFREIAAQQWKAHLARRPEIDAKMKALRLKAWQDWSDNLPEGHPRKGLQPWGLFSSGNLI